MATGFTPGLYVNRSGEYEIRTDGSIWLIGGTDLAGGAPRRIETLPPDAVMSTRVNPEAASGKGDDDR